MSSEPFLFSIIPAISEASEKKKTETELMFYSSRDPLKTSPTSWGLVGSYHPSIGQDNDLNGTSTDTNTAIERGNDEIAYFLRDTREDSWRN